MRTPLWFWGLLASDAVALAASEIFAERRIYLAVPGLLSCTIWVLAQPAPTFVSKVWAGLVGLLAIWVVAAFVADVLS